MEFIVRKTTELTESEKEGVLELFQRIFEKRRSLEELNNQYLQNPFGYSYHSLIIDADRIVGAHTAFPSYYWVGNQRIKSYITGDSMVDRAYRDGLSYLDMVYALNRKMKDEGFALTFGFPNDKAFPLVKKMKIGKEIGRLNTYIFPYRIGGIKSYLKWLNPLTKICCHIILWYYRVGASDKVYCYPIHKDEETYNAFRYKRMDGNYCHVFLDGNEFYYKIITHEGVRTAFLIDVVKKSEANYCKAVSYIVKNENKRFDLLMYVGHIGNHIRKIGLLKIPMKMEPKHFYFTGKVISKNLDESVIYNVENWDVNLSDYDLI